MEMKSGKYSYGNDKEGKSRTRQYQGLGRAAVRHMRDHFLKTFSNICDKDDAIGRKQDVTNMTALINDLVFL